MRRSGTEKGAVTWVRIGLATTAVLATAGALLYFSTSVHATKISGTQAAGHQALSSESLPSKSLPSKSSSVPLFFEPNQGQTAPRVKFLARGKGYGLFLTADEAVLKLQPSARSTDHSLLNPKPASSSVIRMRLDGASSTAHVSGTSPLPGKSNYFIGKDASKWRQNIPQFGGVQYQAVYPGVDLVYYGNQGQLEYDFRVAPGADPNQIALSFNGASAHIISDGSSNSGDLVLTTADGDIRFHAPHIYQPASNNAEKTIAGSFRQLADNKIGFAIGDYDHTRELVIDPILSYSTYIGGSGTEGFVQVAVDSNLRIYLAGSTTSTDFPTDIAAANNPNNPPLYLHSAGGQDIFIAVINPTLTGTSQLIWATYLGGSGSETLAGLAVDSGFGIYVAGTTTSTDFPTTGNAFQTTAPVTVPFIHGFFTKIAFTQPSNLSYSLTYSTYLAGNGTDIVAGLAIDTSCGQQSCNAYLTGSTTSTNASSDFFPANPNGYQTSTNAPAGAADYYQFFASKINTNGNGQHSMIYSTYFGGGNPTSNAIAGCSASNLQPPCGGIAVDPSGNIYITSWTNMLPVPGPNQEAAFPHLDAQQSCINQGSTSTVNCTNDPTFTDAFLAKFNPASPGSSSLIYSTYLGGNGNDRGLAVAVDSATNAYVTGSTTSTNWVCGCTSFQTFGGGTDAFIAKIGPQSGSIFPMNYFTYLGGPGNDVGNAIQVDSVGTAHIAGSTSGSLPTSNAIETSPLSSYDGSVYGGGGDAFVATILTSGATTGNSVSYLGGSGLDQGTGIALDINGATYVAGNTMSSNFPTVDPFQPTLNANSQDAFVSKLGAFSKITLTSHAASPAPSPVNLGAQVAFTFDITNTGPDPASQITFFATVSPDTGLASLTSPPTGRVTGGTGTCQPAQGQTEIVTCSILSLAVNAMASVEIDVTTNASTTPVVKHITVTANATANGGDVTVNSGSQMVDVVDFNVSASTSTPTITAGQTASIMASFCPSDPTLGYSATVTPTDTITPSMVTATTPTFNPTTVTLSGSSCQSTTLTIPTVARPVTTGSLFRHGSFYAAWLPIAGLSLIGLGLGFGNGDDRKHRRCRSMIGVSLLVLAAALILLPGCGSSSTPAPTGGGTQAGIYNITISASVGTASSHTATVQLRVN